ncbi:flagellar biosynthetic protein FliR [Chitiniphilus eburneus]|uniref:Flagellar biosynthetic protein FliR n=1 Tax=Chitiniphilus eburneus TaxID=2571148 RepID=A0A4U0PWI8_9NEIS|nr:flagellar biosynthetic protein FliR [Chitiniphilus eburneus]TJZ72906.1 flagellar biosynthetic protein FliR [Chitiniphilus eburneus]
MLTITQAQIDMGLALFWWPFLRLLGFMLADPFYSNRAIKVQVRVSLCILLAVLIAPTLPPPPPFPVVSAQGFLIALNQLLIGVAIGFMVRLFFTAVEMAGNIAGLQMGMGFAMFYDPQNAANTPVVAQFFSFVNILVFLALNGHLIMLRVMIDSFTQLPPMAQPLGAVGFKLLAEQGGQIFRIGLLLALPVVGTLLVTNLSIGVMTRAAPQLNVFAIGFPLMLALGFVALYFTLPYLAPHIAQLVNGLTRLAENLITAFANPGAVVTR